MDLSPEDDDTQPAAATGDEDMPPAPPDQLGDYLQALREELRADPSPRARWNHLAAMRRAATTTAAAPRRSGRRVGAVAIAVAATVGSLGITAGLAAAGNLPGPAQDQAAELAELVGVHLPAQSDHQKAPGSGSTPHGTRPDTPTGPNAGGPRVQSSEPASPGQPPGKAGTPGKSGDPRGNPAGDPGKTGPAPGKSGDPHGDPHGNPAGDPGKTGPDPANDPGTSGTAPGKSGTAPGKTGTAPGKTGTAPGKSGTAPGQSGTRSGASSGAPRLSGSVPGHAGTAPGATGVTPGQSGTAPGRSVNAPGRSDPPGRSTLRSNRA